MIRKLLRIVISFAIIAASGWISLYVHDLKEERNDRAPNIYLDDDRFEYFETYCLGGIAYRASLNPRGGIVVPHYTNGQLNTCDAEGRPRHYNITCVEGTAYHKLATLMTPYLLPTGVAKTCESLRAEHPEAVVNPGEGSESYEGDEQRLRADYAAA